MGKPFKIFRVQDRKRPKDRHLLANFQVFCETLRMRDRKFKNSPYPDELHYYMHVLQNVEKDNISELFIEMYRGVGKTSILVAPYIAWRLAKDHSLRILVLSQNRLYSEMMTQAVLDIIENQLPWLYHKKTKKKYQSKLYLKHNRPYKEPSLLSASIESRLASLRSDIILCDDVCTIDNADTPRKLEMVLNRFRALPSLFGERNVLLMVIGTPGPEGDLNSLIRAGKFGDEWKRFYRPLFKEKDVAKLDLPEAPITLEQGKELYKMVWWKQNINLKKFVMAYNSGKLFWSQFLLRPPVDGAKLFYTQLIKKMPMPAPELRTKDVWGAESRFKAIAISVDPASGLGEEHDDTVILVCALDREGMWHILDGWGSNTANLEQISNAWALLARKWMPPNSKTPIPTIVESVNVQAWAVASFHKKIPNAQINTIHMKINKERRIVGMLSPIIAGEKLIVHPFPGIDKLMQQLDEYGSGYHDDYPDTLSNFVWSFAHLDPDLSPILKNMKASHCEMHEVANTG